MAAARLARILDARGATRVRLSPDETWLGYVTDVTGTPQLWKVPIAGGMPRRLTFDCDRVGAYRISPDGSRVAYGADQGGNEKWQIWVMDADGAHARRLTHRDDRIHHVRTWTPDGDALLVLASTRDHRFFDLWSYPADGGAPRLLYQQEGTASDATALADGSVVVTTNRRRSDENDLVLVAAGGTARRLTPDGARARHTVIGVVDGRLAVRSDRGRDLSGLATVSLDGTFHWLITPERDVEDAAASAGRAAYALNVDGFSEIHVRERERDTAIAGLPPGCLALDLIGDALDLVGDTVAVAWARYDAPSAVFVSRGGAPFTEVVPPVLAGLGSDELPDTRLVSWPTFDGRRIPGFLLTPRGTAGGPRATVIEVHGGPEGQARPSWNPRTIMLNASGYNVLQPNVRGSTGYGKAYQALDDVALRMDSVRDLDAAAAWLAHEGVAPPDRIAVMGGSYGGYMTLAALAFFPERGWAAAVDVYGVSNFVTFFEHTDPWRRPLRAAEYGDPVRDRDLLVALSPATRIDRVRAPLMFIHGANDPRVPIEETEQIVSALRSRGIDVDYLRYEDEGHSLAKAKNRSDAYPKVLAFLERHLGAPGGSGGR